MGERNAEVDAYLNGVEKWRQEIEALRSILLDCPLREELKWRSPCYTYRKSNLVTIWGLKDCSALGFFKGVLLKDAAGILAAPGENSRSMRVMKFTGLPEIRERRSLVKEYVLEAVEAEKAGMKVEFRQDDLADPEELTAKLAEDPALKAAFESLTPGRQRGYRLHFSGARQARTRVARIEKCVPRILEGKGLNDR